MLKKITFNISGMHCQSCQSIIEEQVGELSGVRKIKVDFNSGEARLEFDQDKIKFSQIKDKIRQLNYQVEKNGVKDKEQDKKSGFNFLIGLLAPILLAGLIAGYFLLAKFGGLEILAKVNEKHLSFSLIFLIGVLASFHCLGMCGGLVVAYSASHSLGGENKSLFWPHLQYNLGRLVSYTLVGAILGGLGSFFAINPVFSGALMFLAGSFMILMAISLFTQMSLMEFLKIKLPANVCKFVVREQGKSKGPLYVGLLTGLMPCGPLQAMQFYALGTGSIFQGALSLAVFALGTAPVMLVFGAAVSKLSHQYLAKMFRLSGIIVLILGLMMLSRGIASLGIRPQINTAESDEAGSFDSSKVQIVKMDLTYSGYQPNVLYAKAGVLVRWVINVSQLSGCLKSILMPEYNINQSLKLGENVIEFTPARPGEIKFSCGMQMVWGKFIIQ